MRSLPSSGNFLADLEIREYLLHESLRGFSSPSRPDFVPWVIFSLASLWRTLGLCVRSFRNRSLKETPHGALMEWCLWPRELGSGIMWAWVFSWKREARKRPAGCHGSEERKTLSVKTGARGRIERYNPFRSPKRIFSAQPRKIREKSIKLTFD